MTDNKHRPSLSSPSKMAISKRLFIYATFILSCAAVALTVTAFATKEWVVGEMRPSVDDVQKKNDVINYGLFEGSYVRNLYDKPSTTVLFITCALDINSCVWSCNRDKDDRVRELQQLYIDGTGESFKGCTANAQKRRARAITHSPWEERDDITPRREADQTFLNAGLRIATIVFLAFALLFAVVGTVFAVINSAINPIELITGIFGLYVWNGIAILCDVIVLGLWGGHFATTLVNNVAYTEVITGDLISKDLAALGFSYWCVLGATALHISNLVLLGVRQLLINREPPPATIQVEESNDGNLFLY